MENDMTNRSCFQFWYKRHGAEVVAHGKTKKSLCSMPMERFRKGIYLAWDGDIPITVFQHEAILNPPVSHAMKSAIADYWIKNDWGTP